MVTETSEVAVMTTPLKPGNGASSSVTGHVQMKLIRVLLADDHELFRAGIRSLMQNLEGIQIVAEANNGREALSLSETHRPNVVLMDIMMPELNGLDATARLAAILPESRVIMLTIRDSEECVRQALQCGAVGYLPKNISPSELEKPYGQWHGVKRTSARRSPNM